MRRLEYIIEQKDEGRRACDFLRREQHFSYALIVKLRHAPESLRLDGEFIRTIDRLKAGSVLSVTLPETAGEAAPNGGISVSVMYEDEDIVVFDKPAGVPVHPSKGHQTDTLANLYAAKYPCSRFRVIGRLDMDTSGIVLAAKNAHAAAVLTDSEIKKGYIAVTEGVPTPAEGRIDAPIDDTDPKAHRRFVAEGGRAAVTDYRVIKSGGGLAALKVFPKTGRTHQIRVHMSYIGCPLAGDELYGGSRGRINRHALHRFYLEFCHPESGKQMEFRSPLPQDMQKLLDEMSTEERTEKDEQGY